MKKVFLENLPRYNGKNNKVNWNQSINYRVFFIYDEIKGYLKIIDHDIKNQMLIVEYLNQNYKIQTNSLIKCWLGKVLNIRTSEFKINIGNIFKDDKRDLNIIDREIKIRNKGKYQEKIKFYKYHCNICGYEKWMGESDLLKGQNCSCCNRRLTVEGINDIPTTESWMIPYFQGGYNEAKLYSRSSSQRIYPICPDCGRVKDKSLAICDIYNKHSIGCSCSDGYSYPNKFMFNLLEQLNINFTQEYNPEWIKPMKYDFYFKVNSKKYIIEMDGFWHFEDNLMNGRIKKESQEIDNYKNKLAEQHNIKVIRINCIKSELGYIKNNIINSELTTLFNLSLVNWLKCEEFSLSNLVKKACEIKKENLNLSTKDIGEIMKLNRHTIIRYLKKGTKIGWCNYDPKEEIEKSVENRRKKVICLESGNIYDSMCEANRQTNIHKCNISACCIGKQKTAGGYQWMYYDDYLKLYMGLDNHSFKEIF